VAENRDAVQRLSPPVRARASWGLTGELIARLQCTDYLFSAGGGPLSVVPAKEFPHQYARARVMGCY